MVNYRTKCTVYSDACSEQNSKLEELERLHGKWVQLKKNASRPSGTQQANEKALVNGLANLFHMEHMDALNLSQVPRTEFLTAQCGKGAGMCASNQWTKHMI